jgi:U3 small nucleolar RNA-associated protein 3
MGRRKSRNTAKTGDKKLYASREAETPLAKSSQLDSDDDQMYNEVDRYHNRREEEVMHLDKDDDESESEDDGITKGREAVFDLGVGGSSSEEDDSDDDDDDDESSSDDKDDSDGSSDEEEATTASSDSESDDFEDEPTESDILNWGKKIKKDYYGGDTADLEIGQDEEDAEMEEEAGREVVRARLEKMDEDDFMLDEDEDENDDMAQSNKSKESSESGKVMESATIETIKSFNTREKLLKLSTKEKMKLLKFSHPELLPIVEHFRDSSIHNLLEETHIATNALTKEKENAEAVGATPDGLLYLVTKAMLQTSTALNVCQYLLLKAEHASSETRKSEFDDNDFSLDENKDDNDDVKNHPVIRRLNQYNDLAERLNNGVEKKIPSLNNQIQSLVKATALMENGDIGDASEGESSAETTDSSEIDDSDNDIEDEKGAMKLMKSNEKAISSDEESSSDEDEDVVRGRVMNEARFAHRPQDVTTKSNSKRRRAPVSADFGDIEEDDEAALAAGRSLAIKLNSISQKSNSKNKKNNAAPEDQDDADDEKFRRAMEMMEEEYGAGSDENDEDDDNEDIEMDDDDNEFYSMIKKKSKDKKDLKKKIYSVAPKFPTFAGEIEGERSISKQILKNRGLVAHKAKINRNPRVKKREQYRKALIRRKGAIREIRTDEAHKYGGEETGIKSRLSRSRKLGML